jgi:type IV pilus assembly protein PilY1
VTSTPAGAAFAGLLQLTQQTITTVPVTMGASTTNYFKVSSNVVTWGDGLTGTRGWYIDLPNSGQRVAYPVERLAGTFILATTLSPVNSAASDVCVQTGSGSGWAYVIDGLTGSGPSKRILNTNGDSLIDGNDALVSGWQDAVDGRPTPITLESTKLRDSYCIETAQVTCTKVQLECGQLGAKACPPAAIPGLKSRQWRQLFMR